MTSTVGITSHVKLKGSVKSVTVGDMHSLSDYKMTLHAGNTK